MSSAARPRIGRPSRLVIGVVAALVAVVVVVAIAVAVRPEQGGQARAAACPGDEISERSDWAPFSTNYAATYDQHPFVGNGYLGLRVPPAGAGYLETGERTGWPLYTPRFDGAFVAGLYGRDPAVADGLTVAAAVPNWSTLLVGVGAETYSPTTPSGQVTNFRQTEFLRCGMVRTALTWTTRDGRATDLTYDVLADRADQHAAAVHLTVTPHWAGQLTVTDLLDHAGARRLDPVGATTSAPATQTLEFRTRATNVVGDIAATLTAPGARVQQHAEPASTTQRAALDVTPGKPYEFTKFVGVDTALTAPDPARAALDAAHRAAAQGWPNLLAAQGKAWRALWASDIETPGKPDVQRWARGALYSLYSASNPQQDNSISPTGLSSDNYGGLIFWDADIWMYPGLLQLAPTLARSVVDYRYRTLPAAQENAKRLGYPGAFYPWTSAATGDLWTDCHSWSPPHCLTQIHLQGDVSLAAWQYYLATRDTDYLRTRIWPIMSNLAEFWAARATPNPDGSYSIRNVAGPDEYSNGVDDGVYTNGVAAEALRNATAAARVLGQPAPPAWNTVADHLRMPFDPVNGVYLQYDGYRGSQIKQADTVLLEYPLAWPMPPEVAAKTLDYYAARTDPDGPAMTDSVHAIDAARGGEPGCSVGTYLDRSARPFAREPFGQFAEARGSKAGATDPLAGSPAFDFTTLAGGYVQEFTNGLLGLRIYDDRVRLDPLLPPQLAQGLTVRGIHWQGRVFDVAAGPEHTTVTLTSGPSLPVETSAGVRQVDPGRSLRLPTRRPDLTPTDDAARCRTATASSEQPGDYAEAAVDGDPGTEWLPATSRADLTVDLGAVAAVTRVAPQWTDPAPAAWDVSVSRDNSTWTPLALTQGGDAAYPMYARYVRVHVSAADPNGRPGIRELNVATRPG
ncbi:discoidin domain-containing protein [Nocardia terpenica]|uniref:discoidin domain-containing protein n=1 Tax=Nocardia terpenica TaxID=455432 RepID=UPI001895CB84|nr:discoidin domain-containing protein [Nocardia terpenica]MBF6062426.1 discoidin domain-containing protein [Nocardia terpenica]MBF6104514.1 discoidin domain-containing protein [Nocardia terpenica]MBF6109631.1 discoidin domain-containing protein [Nocardia terpenica]MBF6119936.1 discoidin domain-containing protein [Nocardia terpenica]MBF6152347.1 discoidin domain-containing protein [Nocardia terpenica]